ncbi:lysylphosphatidylglycerol synthase transmembrane domain-containing protein [Corynebacterium caspium]|uniref:lysylphosphatidylglycerol synthase transmembrane domain-containing protein n=1 Tax=Corynebacterium caspium TaxID=234828 RepID=UPI000364E2D4|nr:YbhN family protein [Corynebacterium caspium]WKD59968.1 hypothetical protein CCASP_07965 [Corynebacterium caspium DSM 44850]
MSPRRRKVLGKLREHLRKPWVQWGLSLLLLAVVVHVFRSQLTIFKPGLLALRQAHPAGLFTAILTTALSFFAMAEVMVLLLRAGHIKVSRAAANALVLAANAWSVTVPGGAAFAAFLGFQVQRRWGASVALCSWFFVISSALSTLWLVVLGLSAGLFLGAAINLLSLLATFGTVFGLTAAVFWATSHPKQLNKWVSKTLPRLNKLLRAAPERGLPAAQRHIAALGTVKLSSWQFIASAWWSLWNRLLDIATLAACAWAITGSLPILSPEPDNTMLSGILLAFVTAKIVGTVQATPGGLGPIEATLIATLVATGMTAVSATATVLMYRLITLVGAAICGWLIYALTFARHGFSACEEQEPAHNLQ